jgi:hypothetical protein
MSRISRLDRSQVTTEMAVHYDNVFAQCCNVPNIFRVVEPATPGEGGCAE